MRHLNKIVVLLVAFSLILSACAPAAPAATQAPAAPASTLAVGIVLPTKDEPRWIQDETRFKDALTAAGYQVEILFSQGDSAKEKANVEALLTKGIKVLIICPQDGNAAAAAVEEARKAGVKVISYDRLITGTDAVDFYATFDSISVGKAQAQYLVDKNAAKGSPLYLYAGAASDNNAFLFFEGAWTVLQPKIADGTFVIKNSSEAVALQGKATLTRDEMSKIVGQVTTNWDFNTAKNLAEANLTAAAAADKGDVSILAPNDGTARAIADAFKADKDVKSYVVTGQDAEKASVQYIIDGKQSMTVFKDVRTLVKDAIGMAVSVLKGETVATTGKYNNGKIDVPAKQSEVITVDKANVKAALVDSGYYQAADFTGLDAAAAPAAPAAADERLFVFLPKGLDNPYWDACRKGMEAEMAKKGVKAEFLGPEVSDAAKQVAIIESVIARKPAAIAISPNDPATVMDVISKATAAGIKVITWDADAPDSERLLYIGTDNKAAGGTAAEEMAKVLGGKGKVAILTGSLTALNAQQRVDGFVEVMKAKYPDIEIVATEPTDDDAAKSLATAEALLQAHPDLAGFYGVTGNGVPGAGKALQGANMCGKVKVVGFDVVPQGIELMKAGCVDALISQRPFGMTAQALDILIDLADGKPSPGAMVDTGVEVVYPAGLDTFLTTDH